MWHLWKFPQKFWNHESPQFLFCQHFKQDHSLHMVTRPFRSSLRISVHLPLNILHYSVINPAFILFWSRTLHIIHDGFLQHCAFVLRKRVTAWISHLARLLITGDKITHFVQTRTLGHQLCDGLQGNESCDTTLHEWATPSCPLLH
jgi:hypothetical protein